MNVGFGATLKLIGLSRVHFKPKRYFSLLGTGMIKQGLGSVIMTACRTLIRSTRKIPQIYPWFIEIQSNVTTVNRLHWSWSHWLPKFLLLHYTTDGTEDAISMDTASAKSTDEQKLTYNPLTIKACDFSQSYARGQVNNPVSTQKYWPTETAPLLNPNGL